MRGEVEGMFRYLEGQMSYTQDGMGHYAQSEGNGRLTIQGHGERQEGHSKQEGQETWVLPRAQGFKAAANHPSSGRWGGVCTVCTTYATSCPFSRHP